MAEACNNIGKDVSSLKSPINFDGKKSLKRPAENRRSPNPTKKISSIEHSSITYPIFPFVFHRFDNEFSSSYSINSILSSNSSRSSTFICHWRNNSNNFGGFCGKSFLHYDQLISHLFIEHSQ